MNEEKNILLQAMYEAGEAILTLQKTDFSVKKKANNDIVTKADILANDILKTKLTRTFPEYGWLSEETEDDLMRLSKRFVWIVDPIDGTKEYAAHIPEYAISVALVENGVPILAAIFNPATNELFHAIKNHGAWLNHRKIQCSLALSFENNVLLVSRTEYQRGQWDAYQRYHRIKQAGSIAYKLARLAAGCAIATLSLGPKNEWDIAAGTLLVTEAGGIITNRHRDTLLFNRKAVKVDGIVATAPEFNDQMFDLIAALNSRSYK